MGGEEPLMGFNKGFGFREGLFLDSDVQATDTGWSIFVKEPLF